MITGYLKHLQQQFPYTHKQHQQIQDGREMWAEINVFSHSLLECYSDKTIQQTSIEMNLE